MKTYIGKQGYMPQFDYLDGMRYMQDEGSGRLIARFMSRILILAIWLHRRICSHPPGITWHY